MNDLDLYEGKDKNGTTHIGKRILSGGKAYIAKWKGAQLVRIEVQPQTIHELKIK